MFLDEIGEMVPALQAKLLRFLEEKAFKRVGGAQDIRVDVRVIAATNRNLEDAVRQGTFREDLYYRLNVLPLALPPLRAHPSDIPALVRHYVDGFNREFRKNVPGVSPEALKGLETYRWPGNIRELRNAVERAMLLTEGDRCCPITFPCWRRARSSRRASSCRPAGIDLEQLERELVVQALTRTGGNQTRAAGTARPQSRPDPLPHREVRPQDIASTAPSDTRPAPDPSDWCKCAAGRSPRGV